MTSRPPVRPDQRRLVGREAELARLAAALAEVRTGGCRLLLVGGDAGAGKTSLVDAAASAAIGAVTVRGQCIPLGGEGLPYAPVAGVLRALESMFGRDRVLDWAGGGHRALGTVVPDLVTPETGGEIQLQLFEAMSRLLGRASTEQPLIVIIEDLHWADDSTRNLLRFCCLNLRADPVLLVATYRSDELGHRHPLRPFLAEIGRLPTVSRLDLPPLSRQQTSTVIAQVLGREAAPSVVDRIHRRSGGIPFYIEVLAALDETEAALPETVRDALQARFRRLSEPAQEAARLAAVIGNWAEHDLLTALSPHPEAEVEQRLREVVDSGLLTVDGTGYAFRHALLREAIEADLLPSERVRLHRRAATALEAEPGRLAGEAAPHAIALHWLAGRDWDRAFAWSVSAARSSVAAHAEALRMYEHILELWELVADSNAIAGPQATVLEEAARSAKDAGEYERAVELVSLALEHSEADDHSGRFRRLMFRLHVLIDLIRPGADADAEAAEALLPRIQDPRVRAHALEQLAAYHLNSGHDGRQAAREAVAAAVTVDDVAQESTARNTLGTLLVAYGDEAEGLAELVRAGELAGADARTELRFRLNYSDSLHLVGRYADAVEHALAGGAVARSIGLERAWGGFVLGNAAESMIALGRWTEADELISAELERVPPPMSRTHLSLLAAWLAAWRGDLDGSEQLLAGYRQLLTDPQPFPASVAQLVRVDAEHAMLAGQPERAWADVQFFLDHHDRYGVARALPALTVGAAAALALDRQSAPGRVAQVRAVFDALPDTGSTRLWSPLVEAEFADDVGGWRTAVDHLAVAGAQTHLMPYAQWRLARQLAAARDRTRARSVLEDALARSDQLGAGALTARMTVLASQIGLSMSSSNSPGPLAGLTARELEVLRLVAAGASNADIAAALFISTKTASVHVSNILAKLGSRNRGEAAALAHRVGLSDPVPNPPSPR